MLKEWIEAQRKADAFKRPTACKDSLDLALAMLEVAVEALQFMAEGGQGSPRGVLTRLDSMAAGKDGEK